jgi:sulfate adenylyltransferase subunit 1
VCKIDIQSLDRNLDDKEIEMNAICRVTIQTTKPLMIDEYRDNRNTGSFILIDDSSNETVAAGMIL